MSLRPAWATWKDIVSKQFKKSKGNKENRQTERNSVLMASFKA
jgi:hypothetical protein